MKLPRVMIAAPSSGSGKTLVTCGLLQVLVNRKRKAASFKCGPDYIDPMFHTKVIGTPAYNLDTFFVERDMVRYLFGRHAMKAELSVMEGVMGFYDGLAGIKTKGSSWDLADATDTPVILVVNARGMSLSVTALIKGFLEYPVKRMENGQEKSADSHIRGVILNQTSASVYPDLKKEIEKTLPVKVLGYIPKADECVVESRHLGLVTPNEMDDIKQKLQRLAEVLEHSLDIDAVLELADSAEDIDVSMPEELKLFWGRQESKTHFSRLSQEKHCETGTGKMRNKLRIGVAWDEAFCFYYEDNLELLQQLGAELAYFSPLHDHTLPENIQGMLIGGGYPELYAKKLSENMSMLQSVRDGIAEGLPYLAECGGFMYLHETMEDMEHQIRQMAGVIKGHVYRTERLGRFGYITLMANQPQVFGYAGCQIKAHEFHYFDSSNNGEAFHAQKPFRKSNWNCMITGDRFAAGFPHLYYYSNPDFAVRFIKCCQAYGKTK